MKLLYNGCTKLISNMSFLQIGDALLYAAEIKIADAGSFTVFLRSIFDVHCHIINKSLFNKVLQLIRTAAVCIQLDCIAHVLDFFQKSCQLRI